jgi:hypothetical protein
MAELRIAFRLPRRARAEFLSDYGLRGGKLLVDGELALEASSRAALERGVDGLARGTGHLRLVAGDDADVRVFVDGVEAPREDRLRAPTSRSAWIHGWLALWGSAFGFVASWLYVRRAEASGDPWAMKMAVHMAAWHLLLTLTLFPASVWGQRIGIRAVQLAAAVFFCIHAGIALANLGAEGPGIWLLNASSGLAFLATVLYGLRAYRDMDPLRDCATALERGSARVP